MSVTLYRITPNSAFSGAKLYTYEPGTTTAKSTYPTQDDATALTNANANPVVLDSAGYAQVWLSNQYKMALKSSDDATTYYTEDEVGDLAGTNALPKHYIADLAVTIGTDTDHDVDIAVGEARDADDSVDITVSSTITVAIDGAAGSNAIDTGTVDPSRFYYVWLIDDSSGTNSPAGVFSLSASSPTLPTGYDKKRIVGWVFTDGSSNIGEVLRADRRLLTSPIADFGSWSLLDSQTASTSASLDLVNGIDGTFDAYVLVLNNILPATDGVGLELRLSTDTGSTWKTGANDYEYALDYVTSAAGTANSVSAGATHILINRAGGTLGSAAGEGLSGTIQIFKPSVRTPKVEYAVTYLSSAATPELDRVRGGGTYNGGAETFNAFQLIMSSGNIASGDVALYGLRK